MKHNLPNPRPPRRSQKLSNEVGYALGIGIWLLSLLAALVAWLSR